ncbi:hypothetical protein HYT24_01915 [Candidatus Pacearchaeota archaeon]|nr:hypothetical protein [Candidatus Pacearchaeota archaeon]
MNDVDAYIENVIRQGDKGSSFLAQQAAPTLKNNPHIDIIQDGVNGISVIRPQNYWVEVHSFSGNPKVSDLERYSQSAVSKLVDTAFGNPVGFANVIDSRTGDIEMLARIMKGLVGAANTERLAILNGENAILGKVIPEEANVSCTMVSLMDPKKGRELLDGNDLGMVTRNGINHAIFNPNSRAVYMNSDGVGTKTDCYARNGTFQNALDDSAAMKGDDTAKIGARVKVFSDVVEYRGNVPLHKMEVHARELSERLGIVHSSQFEDVEGRLWAYEDGAPAFNVSGSAVSVIDENRLRNPLVPKEGERVVAIRGPPNPRSNGITARREIMEKVFGPMWHNVAEAAPYVDYLTRPSNIMFPLFDELIDNGLATSVTHLSGGSYNGKLAKPLGRHGLYAELKGLFEPDPAEKFFIENSGSSVADMYQKWPMGTDAFITTRDLRTALEVIAKHGREGKNVGMTQRRGDGRTGVELTTYNGEKVSFSG